MANRKIVRVKRSSKYSDRIIIHLDDKSVFRIPEDVFVSNPLHAGETVSLEKIASFGKKMRLQEARDAAFRLLGYRMRSIAEMKKRLKDNNFDEEEIGKTIHYLIDKKYLNDEEFGKAFVKEKVKNKSSCLKNKKEIVQELKSLFTNATFLESKQNHYYYKKAKQYISQFEFGKEGKYSDGARVECLIISKE